MFLKEFVRWGDYSAKQQHPKQRRSKLTTRNLFESCTINIRAFEIRSLVLTVLLGTFACSKTEGSNGQDIQAYIQTQDALSGYLSEILEPIADELGRGDIQVNREYQPSKINVYIVKPNRLDPSRMNELGVPNIGDAVAIEEDAVILINEAHLQKLVTLSILFFEMNWSTARSMAELELGGLSSFQHLWDPSRNPALSSDEIESWRTAVRGAVGFLLAHESGHIVLGRADPTQVRTKHIFVSPMERDLHWACPNLVDERATAHRDIEARADDFGLQLIRAVDQARSYARYENGATWYFAVLLEQNFIDSIGRINNLESKPHIRNELERRYNDRFQTLLSKRQRAEQSNADIVAEFYPRSHPDTLSRLMATMDVDRDAADLMSAWATRIKQECATLRPL